MDTNGGADAFGAIAANAFHAIVEDTILSVSQHKQNRYAPMTISNEEQQCQQTLSLLVFWLVEDWRKRTTDSALVPFRREKVIFGCFTMEGCLIWSRTREIIVEINKLYVA